MILLWNISSNNESIQRFALTNSNGTAQFSNLPDGNYNLTELQAPYGYKSLTGNLATVTIEFGQIINVSNSSPTTPILDDGEIIGLKVINELIEGRMVIKKVDPAGKALQGFAVDVYDANSGGNKVGVYDDGGTGNIILNLVPGTIYIEEIVAPQGYQVRPGRMKIDVTDTMDIRSMVSQQATQ